MKKLSILAIALIALVAAPSAFAKKGDAKKAPGTVASDVYANYDTNKNGALDADEKAALIKAFDADKSGPLKVYDTNSDGKLSDAEIAAIPVSKTSTAPVKAKGKKNK